MDGELFDIYKEMIFLGEESLRHANYLANFYNMGYSSSWDVLSVLQAAHAMEIFIKARIAKEHPLLLLDKYPKENSNGDLLSYEDLMEKSTTIQYKDLPSRLWAATGMKLKNLDNYREFGTVRNQIQHLGTPKNIDFSNLTNSFVHEVIHPFIHECWGLYAIDYTEDDYYYESTISHLITQRIKVVISPSSFKKISLDKQAILTLKSNDDYSSWFQNEMSIKSLDFNKLILI